MSSGKFYSKRKCQTDLVFFSYFSHNPLVLRRFEIEFYHISQKPFILQNNWVVTKVDVPNI